MPPGRRISYAYHTRETYISVLRSKVIFPLSCLVFVYKRSQVWNSVCSLIVEVTEFEGRQVQANPHPVEALGSDLRESGALSRVFLHRRRELGLTQKQVADAFGVSVQWLSEFENAKGDFGVVRLMRVAAVLGLSLAVHPRPVTDIDLVFEQLGAKGQPE